MAQQRPQFLDTGVGRKVTAFFIVGVCEL